MEDNSNLRLSYLEFMKTYEYLWHMKMVPDTTLKVEQTYYLSHCGEQGTRSGRENTRSVQRFFPYKSIYPIK